MTSWHRKPVAAACLLGGLLALARPAWSETPEFARLCSEGLPAPSLQVRLFENGYRVDRQRSYRELTGMGADLLRHGKRNVLGITQAELTANIEINLARLQDNQSGQECMSPQVVISIGYKPILVFIGREFPPDSCSYREILEHEMRHVGAYRHHLPLAQAAVRAQLAPRLKNRIFYGEADRLEAQLKAEVYDHWLPMVETEIGKVTAIQEDIDSAEEYERMENVCDGEVQGFLSSGS